MAWDESVSYSTKVKWLKLREDFKLLERISLPRWLGTLSTSLIGLHGFSNASQFAKAAVLYVRVHTSSGIWVSILCSKTKVASLKPVSIPRLELIAAHLLSKLVNHFISSTKISVKSIILWTGSMTAHTWIGSHPSRWKEFVRNRVHSIQELTPTAQWRHVPGPENPADCASLGILTSQLIDHSLWWHGPSCLSQSEEN